MGKKKIFFNCLGEERWVVIRIRGERELGSGVMEVKREF